MAVTDSTSSVAGEDGFTYCCSFKRDADGATSSKQRTRIAFAWGVAFGVAITAAMFALSGCAKPSAPAVPTLPNLSAVTATVEAHPTLQR